MKRVGEMLGIKTEETTILSVTNEEETKQENDETKLQDITTTFYLDSSDMFGNVYNF